MSGQVQKFEEQKAPAVEHSSTTMAMINTAVANGASIETVERLMGLHERWEANQARKSFDEAVANAKAKMKPVERNATGHNSKRYANLAAYATSIDPILSEFGLSYRFKTNQTDRISVTCVLSHKDGHSEETTLSSAPDTSGNKNAIQAIGSAVTYLQRYTLIAALGLAASDDDDGRMAGSPPAEKITEEQVMDLRELIEATGSDERAFCRIGKVERLQDIPATEFDSAVNMLKRKMKGAA